MHVDTGHRSPRLARPSSPSLERSGADPRGNREVAIVADTPAKIDQLNAVIRDRLIAACVVDDKHATTTTAGMQIVVGEQVATGRNDPRPADRHPGRVEVTRVTPDRRLPRH